jgi:hypothetical protein
VLPDVQIDDGVCGLVGCGRAVGRGGHASAVVVTSRCVLEVQTHAGCIGEDGRNALPWRRMDSEPPVIDTADSRRDEGEVSPWRGRRRRRRRRWWRGRQALRVECVLLEAVQVGAAFNASSQPVGACCVFLPT